MFQRLVSALNKENFFLEKCKRKHSASSFCSKQGARELLGKVNEITNVRAVNIQRIPRDQFGRMNSRL
jgi:hypothetical protein